MSNRKSLLKTSLAVLCVLLLSQATFSQEKELLLKSWIKRESYSLPDNIREKDTLYTRYSFQKSKAYISFYPGWNEYQQDWILKSKKLTIGFTTYDIEELTDSTLIISEPGFRRILFDDENYLNQKAPIPPVAGQFDDKPLYKATRIITPRYKDGDLRKFIGQNLEGYNIRKATTFLVSFIVKEDGSVDGIQVLNGISGGFDAEVINKLKMTSKKWVPAVYKGQPVQTQMLYSIKYLDSIIK